MERRRLDNARSDLRHVAYSMPEGEVADALQDQVKRMLRAGRSRDTLYEDLKHLTLELRRTGRGDLEDAVMDVMDALVGWCSPSARI